MRIPSNRVRDIERYFHSELEGLYPDREIGAFTNLLFEAFLGWDKARLLLHRDDTINQSDLLKFHWAAEDLKHYRPIQYIVGYTDFCGLRIHVGPGVLIPRPETEEIVEKTKHLANRCPRLVDRPMAILDLCTGSGCMALALASHFQSANIYGVDISEAALSVARKNATANRLDVTFLQCDILNEEPSLPDKKFDLIVGNPPYVREKEREAMASNVLDYEPSEALFVSDDDPLLFYRAIGLYAAQHLAQEGMLVLEINEYLGYETSRLLNQLGFDTELGCDFRDKERSIVARLRTS